MFKFLLAAALVAAPLLTGCQSATPVSPTAPVPAHDTVATRPLSAPRLVADTKLRHVLQAATPSTATLFGIQYYGGSYSSWYTRDAHDNWVHHEQWNTSATLSGKGQLTKASPQRFIYQVPDGQCLVLNEINGQGSIAVNGYGIGIPQTGMHYVFGPGELVVFNFAPRANYSDGSGNYYHVTYFNEAISGYLASADLLGGQAGVGDTK